MTSHFGFSGPAIRVQQSTPVPQFSGQYHREQTQGHAFDFGAANGGGGGGWPFDQAGGQMLAASSALHAPSLNNYNTGRSDRGHQRVSSGSSGSSGSPGSPFGHATTLMYANARSPAVPKAEGPYTAAGAEEGSRTYLNHLPTPTQTPTQDSFLASSTPSSYPHFQTLDSTFAAHMAMKQVIADANSVTEDDAPGFSHSTRHSVSSFGRNSPATPQTVNGEDFDDGFTGNDIPTTSRPSVQVPNMYSDDLFQPTSVPASSQKMAKNVNLLSPYHNAMMSERLQQANQARSQSPAANGARALSPFRQGSPYAQAFGSPQGRFSTAAQLRHRQKVDAEASALARQASQDQHDSEPKTISPKDAILEYHESEEDSKMPLFPDTGAAQFNTAFTGGNFHNNMAVSAASNPYSHLAVSTGMGGWSNAAVPNSAASYSTASTATPSQAQFNFAPSSVPGMFHGLPTNSYQASIAASSEETPEFPAHLTSMESSASEAPPYSSQGSTATEPRRPASTLADTGTYTCTYHGCRQRFETPQKLQRHKREAHRHSVQQQQQQQQQSHQQLPQTSIPITPGVGSGMTSAALAERNSQAGPHKCDRINPTTGKPCSTIFSRPYDLTRHEDTIHNIKKQKVRCALCQEEKTFSRNDALTRHMRVVHPDVDFPGKHRRRGGRGDD